MAAHVSEEPAPSFSEAMASYMKFMALYGMMKVEGGYGATAPQLSSLA
jgi:hypothetical protein